MADVFGLADVAGHAVLGANAEKIFAQLFGRGRHDQARRNGVGADALAAVLAGNILRQAVHTGLGGAIYALYVGYIDPDSVLAGHFSILIALPAVLGGVGTLWGPILGAALLIPLKELSSSYLGGSGRGVDLMLYGAMIIIVALARPQGLVSLFRRRDAKAS